MKDPGFVYDALKVYLMLGGQQPPDREMIRAWMSCDLTTLYPGASNVAPIKRLEEHLMAMFDLASGDPLIELDGHMIEEAQKTLARLSVAQRAYALLKSQARASTAGDWLATRRGGNDAARVFEADGGQPLETIQVPEFFTYNGFHKSFIEPLGDIAERIKRERWVLGQAGNSRRLPRNTTRCRTRCSSSMPRSSSRLGAAHSAGSGCANFSRISRNTSP